MASDLKIEILANILFDRTDIFQMFGEECYKVENITEMYDFSLILPIICRRQLFMDIYLDDFTDEKAKSLSLSECYNYVSSKCDYLFGGLTVFERMFATFAFVLDFCTCMLDYDRVDVIENGHIFWAMYFDKFTEEFYLKGGWRQLKEVAESYSEIFSILSVLNVETNFELKEAIENYLDFKNRILYEEHKRKQKKENVSKLWIKFRKQSFENYIIIPTTDNYLDTVLEVEDLLTSLKNVLGIPSTDRKCSEINTDDADNKMNTNDAIGIQNLPDRKCETSNANQMHENISNRNPTPCNFPDEMLFHSETEDARGNKKLTLEKSLETRGPKKETDLKETDNKMEMIPTSHTSEAENNEKISTCILPTSQFIDAYIDELYSKHTKIEETLSAPEVFSTNQIHNLSHGRKRSPYRATEEMNLCSQSDSDGDVNQKTLEEADFSKIGDDQTEVAERKTKQLENQLVKSKSNENSHILPTSQFIDAYIDELYSKNTKIEETPSAPEVLSANQMPKSFIDRKLSPSRGPEVTNHCFQNVVSESDEEVNKKTLEATPYSKKRDHETDVAERKAMQLTIQVSESDEYSRFLPTSQFIDAYIDDLHSKNTKIEETPSEPEDLSTNQVQKFFHYRNLCPCKITGAKNLCSQSDSNFEVNKTLEVAHCLKNESDETEASTRKAMQFTSLMAESESDEYSHILPTRQFIDEYIDELYSSKTKIEETPSAPEVLSTKQITKSKRDGNTTSDTLPTPKVSSPANGCKNTGDETKQIDGTQEDIRKEQEDRFIKIFLRMILVLDNREGTKLVRQGLQSMDEDSQKTEVIRNKKKKKSKKKSKKD